MRFLFRGGSNLRIQSTNQVGAIKPIEKKKTGEKLTKCLFKKLTELVAKNLGDFSLVACSSVPLRLEDARRMAHLQFKFPILFLFICGLCVDAPTISNNWRPAESARQSLKHFILFTYFYMGSLGLQETRGRVI